MVGVVLDAGNSHHVRGSGENSEALELELVGYTKKSLTLCLHDCHQCEICWIAATSTLQVILKGPFLGINRE